MERLGEILQRIQAGIGTRNYISGVPANPQEIDEKKITQDFTSGVGTSPNDCPYGRCDGSGWIMQDRMAHRCSCLRDRLRREKVTRLFGRTKIPRRYRGKGFVDVDTRRSPEAWEHARQFVDEWDIARKSGRWLFVSGEVGTGKTLLGYVIIQELMGLGVAVVADTVPDLLDALRPGREQNSHECIQAVRNAELLFLDDLGTQRDSEWVEEKLFQIINHRYDQELPTIITSNRRLDKLGTGLVWEAIADRIAQQAAPLLRLDGNSYRIEAARLKLMEPNHNDRHDPFTRIL